MVMRSMEFFMDYYLALILIGSQLWSYSVCQRLPEYNIYTSQSVTVQRGLCVHVPCSFTVPSDKQLSISTTGIWYNVLKGLGLNVVSKTNLKHQTNGSFFLTGNVSSGDCSYSIEDPKPTDEGKYFFRVEDGPIRYNYQNIQTYVNVTELTDKPTISSTRLVDGEEVTLTCSSPGRCRNIRPQITWEGAMNGIRQKTCDILYENGSRTFHSDITFTPRKSHNNSTLSCRVTFKSNLSTVEERTLNVEYPDGDEEKESSHLTYIILLATIGTICPLLLVLALLVFDFWRKRQKKMTSAEMESTYTDLRRSDITSIYDQLKPEIPADTNVIESYVAADNDYGNVQ